jgi:tRNA pseudouridine38-40 synthase
VRNLRLTLAYDGTDFWGWQVQRRGRTVQGVVEAALERMHGHAVRVTAAGRTDSGVHARGQVVNFRAARLSVPDQDFYRALNSYLPPDVRALDSCEVEDEFNSRKSARLRIYQYYTVFGGVGLPHLRRYCLWRRHRPDLTALNLLASAVTGEHDFTTFASADDDSPSKRRHVRVSCFFPEGPFLVYKIAADSFLRRMVRSIVGTLLEVEAHGGNESGIRELLSSPGRHRAGQTAPARGLFLHKVIYDGEDLTPV